MKLRDLRTAAATVAAVLLLSAGVSAAPSVSARSAILMDAGSGRVLFEKDADRKSLIASTTKIMTGLLVAEAGNLEDCVTVPQEAVGIEGSSLYLKAGEELTVEQLLYGMMLRSGNDAAVALAIVTSGSVERFVEEMNRKAQELELTETHFANPNGLDDEGNYSTARDLAKLAAFAMENQLFRRVVSTKSISFGDRSVANHNKLLWQYEGAVGVKTGFTKAAGRLLVSAAERDGRRLVAVTIHAPDDWADHRAMLDYGFSAFTPATLAAAGEGYGAAAVIGGTAMLARCRLAEGLVYPMLPDETARLRVCLPRFVWAPVTEGAPAGYVEALVDGQPVGRAELVWDGSVAPLPEKSGSILARLFGG